MNEIVFLTKEQVMQRVAIAESTLYKWIAAGSFPAQIKLRGGKSSRWLEHEITEWQQQQIAYRNQTVAYSVAYAN